MPQSVTIKSGKRKEKFCWNKVPGDDNGRLIRYLKQNFGTEWAKPVLIEKVNNKTIKVSTDMKSLSLTLNDAKTKVSLFIGDNRTDELIAKNAENGTLNIFQKRKTGKSEKNLRDFLNKKMMKFGGKWKIPVSSKEYEYKFRSKAVDAALKYYLNVEDGEKRRLEELGEEWAYIWGY